MSPRSNDLSVSPPAREALHELVPARTLLRLAISWSVVMGLFLFEGLLDVHSLSPGTATGAFAVLFATILYAAFGVVHEADHLAHKLGEPYGTLILTLSIVSIEVILIAAVMLGPGESATIGRDSIFAVMMMILNFVTGLCLLLGGLRYGEQEYNSQGAVSYLSMIVLLTSLALVVPNYLAAGSRGFDPAQSLVIAGLVSLLYAAFLAMQMMRYRRFFVQPDLGSLYVPLTQGTEVTRIPADEANPPLDRRAILVRSLTLLALILPIVLLAHDLATLIDFGIERIGAPAAVGGLIIAIIVFTPESITALRAALANQMQRAINLCLGAFVSTVGLTIPAVLVVGWVTGNQVILGLENVDIVLLVSTIGLSVLTFLGLRTSPVQGIMHLALFAFYTVFLFMP